METKTSKAITLFNKGEFKAAFKLFSGFKMGFTKEERRRMQITYECINDLDRCRFYESIGVDYKDAALKSWQLIVEKYLENGQKQVAPHM